MAGAHIRAAAVYVDADVALLGEQRLTGVDAHPHADRPSASAACASAAAAMRTARRRERDEEGIALRVDLDATMRGERFAEQAPVLGERLRVGRCA